MPKNKDTKELNRKKTIELLKDVTWGVNANNSTNRIKDDKNTKMDSNFNLNNAYKTDAGETDSAIELKLANFSIKSSNKQNSITLNASRLSKESIDKKLNSYSWKDEICGVCLEKPKPGQVVKLICCDNILCLHDAHNVGVCPFWP